MRVLIAAAALALQLAPSDGAPRISQDEFKKLHAAKNVIVVDTRNQEAYDRGHIPGAILLPLEGLTTWPEGYERTVAKLKIATKPIVTYCAWHLEATSARAALLLKEGDVNGVRALTGGWNDWVNGGNPIEK